MTTFVAVVLLLLAGAWWYRRESGWQRPISANGSFSVPIVGESNYQDALRAVCGKGEVRHECLASLILEDANVHDPLAVMVTIDDRTVGYLSRDNARTYRRRNGGLAAREVPAVIVGGGRGKPSVGVWLDMA